MREREILGLIYIIFCFSLLHINKGTSHLEEDQSWYP